jgi:hypothetical protein
MSRVSPVPPNPAPASPQNPGNGKAAQSWEDEELAYYEPRRTKAAEEKRKSDAKATLLARQLPLQWNAIRQILQIRCESVNARAKRLVLRSVTPQDDRLEIRREDDTQIDLQFDAPTKRIKFTGKVLGYDREYELTVQTYNGVDTTAWYSPSTLTTEQPDDLAKLMLSILLRADQ